MKHLKSYENKILYNFGDIVKTKNTRLSNHDYVHDVVKIIDTEAFGGTKEDFAYISYKVTTISFDADTFIRFSLPQDRILRKATSEEIKKYMEYIELTDANKFNL